MGAFHAYDIRGRWGVDFDRDTVYKVGFFLPELLGCREVAVAAARWRWDGTCVCLLR